MTIIVDGTRTALVGNSKRGYEMFMFEQGYPAVPKDDVDAVTKQDLIDHPEKFRPYMYSTSSGFGISYKEFAEYGLKYIHYSDGRSIIASDACRHTEFKNKHKLIQDLVYMKKNYPVLYDEMLKKSDIPDIISEAEEQYKKENSATSNKPANSGRVSTGSGGKGKAHHITTPIITPEQVNAEINYTHISESSDLKL